MAILEKQYHDELKLELQGITYSASLSNKNVQSSIEDTKAEDNSLPDPEKVAEDTRSMSKVVMSRKKRKLYEAMQVLCQSHPFNLLLDFESVGPSKWSLLSQLYANLSNDTCTCTYQVEGFDNSPL